MLDTGAAHQLVSSAGTIEETIRPLESRRAGYLRAYLAFINGLIAFRSKDHQTAKKKLEHSRAYYKHAFKEIDENLVAATLQITAVYLKHDLYTGVPAAFDGVRKDIDTKLLAPKTKTEISIDLAKAYSGLRDYDSALGLS